jgi:hypothetical protein
MQLNFKTFLEVHHVNHVNYDKRLMEIYVDPDRRELRELSSTDRMVRGIVTKEHFYAWKDFGDYHGNIMKAYPEMRTGLPIQLWWGNGEAFVMVTDASARNTWKFLTYTPLFQAVYHHQHQLL